MHAHPSLRDAVDVTRFWGLVQRGQSDECWIWDGDRDRDGYGVFFWHGKRAGAHELALSFTSGEQRLADLDTCHSCDNPPCCNPAHLRFDTRSGNMADCVARGRNHVPSKLSAAEAKLIRERREAGARQKDLAREYGVSNGFISMIVRGIRWPDAGGPIQAERNWHHGR